MVTATTDATAAAAAGVRRAGNIVDIKVVAPDGSFWGVKAISPEGWVHDVKGVKMTPDRVETTVHGVKIHAHIKALPPVTGGPY